MQGAPAFVRVVRNKTAYTNNKHVLVRVMFSSRLYSWEIHSAYHAVRADGGKKRKKTLPTLLYKLTHVGTVLPVAVREHREIGKNSYFLCRNYIILLLR